MPDTQLRLTQFSPAAGCGCKLSAEELAAVLGAVPQFGVLDDRLLVGHATNDDAAVYRLNTEMAIVATADFFTPVVDDAFDFGRIAATNAMSDVFAMGGRPILALNIVGWPREGLPLSLLSRVLEGGGHAASAEGCMVVGGHSIDDASPKYGMAVIGVVHPSALLTNARAQCGDDLILTKELGVGVITTAIKRGLADSAHIAQVTKLMTASNGVAARVASAFGIGIDGAVHAGTDVTGFGLLGHLAEMLDASGFSADVRVADTPFLPGVDTLLRDGLVAGGTVRNHAQALKVVDWAEVPEWQQLLLSDAQTSGGLLLSVSADASGDLVRELREAGCLSACVIGRVRDGHPSRIRLVR